jgi:RND family efflux transporter MFP subunit
MEAPTDIRAQLRSLSIDKDQRPVASKRPVLGRGLIKTLVGFGALAGLLIAVYLARNLFSQLSSTPTAEAEGVRLMAVTVRTETQAPPIFTAAGKIVSDHRVEVMAKVSGQIDALYFEQGDRVEKNQLLARIEELNYRARRDQAAAELEKAKATLAYQQVNFDRINTLHDTFNAPDIEFSDAKRALGESKAQVGAIAAMLEFAQKALNDCEVKAPIAGVILERNVEIGDFVAAEGGRGMMANAQFAAIADMNALRVEVDVSELDINRIKKDMPCEVTPDAYKDLRYRGHVLWIDPGANYSKATVQVKVRIDNPDEHLRVEGSAQVAFLSEAMPADAGGETPQASATIWIPKSACILDSQTKSAKVFVESGGKLSQAVIKTGRESGSQIEIVSGLSSGQSIAVDGLDKITDGQRVKP